MDVENMNDEQKTAMGKVMKNIISRAEPTEGPPYVHTLVDNSEDAETTEELTLVGMLIVGDEIRVNGRWLEIHGIRNGNTRIVYDLYDDGANAIRSFAADPYAQRLARHVDAA